MTDLFGDPSRFLQRVLLQLPALLVAVTVHELAHAVVADRLGDPTARRLGRITLNPLPHIDPLGAICLVLAGFGWAKPVPVDARNFSHPVRDMFWVAVAGPIANFLAAFVAVVLYLTLRPSGAVPGPVLAALGAVFVLNLALGIFNLIPLPPLDGGHFLPYLMPRAAAGLLGMLERYGMLILLLLVFTGVTARIISPVTDWAARFMIALARTLRLSGHSKAPGPLPGRWLSSAGFAGAIERGEARRGPSRPPSMQLPRQRPTLPRRYQRSTIGPGGLNFRVRDGNGCGPSGIATGNRMAIVYVDSRVQPSDVELV